MAVTSLDILNLSHSLKDLCEVNCNTPECLSQTLKLLLQYNLIQANLQFGRQQAQAEAAGPFADSLPHPGPSASLPADCPPFVRLDIGDPFLADYENQDRFFRSL